MSIKHSILDALSSTHTFHELRWYGLYTLWRAFVSIRLSRMTSIYCNYWAISGQLRHLDGLTCDLIAPWRFQHEPLVDLSSGWDTDTTLCLSGLRTRPFFWESLFFTTHNSAVTYIFGKKHITPLARWSKLTLATLFQDQHFFEKFPALFMFQIIKFNER